MLTVLFFLSVAIFTVLFAFIFNAFELSLIALFLWVASLLIGVIISILLLFAFVWTVPKVRRKDPLDMTNHRLGLSLMRLLIRGLRLKVDVSGKEHLPPPEEPFILISNHQTVYDILALKVALSDRPLLFIAKKEIFSWPLVGNMTDLLGNVPIERESDRSAAKAILEGIKRYKDGAPVSIFPEGHRTSSNEMLPFRAGAFKLAMKPKAPIIVATLFDFYKTWKGWPFRRNRARIHFHPPIKPSEYEGMTTQALSDEVRATISAQIERFRNT